MYKLKIEWIMILSLIITKGAISGNNRTVPDGLGKEISGYVEDKDGNPISSATIELLNRELVLFPNPGMAIDTGKGIREIPPSHAAQTGIDGYFKIADLSSGKTDILVKSMNYQTRILKDISTGTKDLKIVLEKIAAFKLKGEVADSQGNPVKDVKITLLQNLNKAESKSIQTDGKGLFEFSDILEPTTNLNARELIAQKEGFGIWGKRIDSTGGESYVKITLLPEKTVSGRVVDDKGKTIAGAEIHLWTCRGEDIDFFLGLWQDVAPSVKTDADGTFIFKGIPPRSNVYFNISADGYISNNVQSLNNGYDGGYFVRQIDGTTKTITGVINETQGDIEFVLQKGATLRGTVTYKDTGLPVEGIELSTQLQEGYHRGEGVTWAGGVTDKNGRFELKGVSTNPCNLLVEFDDSAKDSMPEWTAAAQEFENLKPGKVKDNIKIVLVKGGIMRGKVTDVKGNPLQGIAIAFYSSARPRSGAACQVTHTAKDGSWAYRFPSGEVYAYVQTNMPEGISWTQYSYTKKIKVGREIKNIDFKLDRELPANSPYR